MTKHVDWEAIEREYRAGQLSVAEIARQHGITHPAILKRAKRDGWTRNLAARVREKVTERLVTEDVTAGNAQEVVDHAAARGVEVVRQHRRDIRSLNDLAERLRSKADALIEKVESLKDLTDATSAIESLARTTSRLVPLERQAFSLDDARPEDGGPIVIKRVIVDHGNPNA